MLPLCLPKPSQTFCRSVSLLTENKKNTTKIKNNRKKRQRQLARVFKLARRMRVLAQPSLCLCLCVSLARSQTVRCRAKSATDRSSATSEIRSCRALTAEAEVGADDAAEAVDENVSKAKAALQRRRRAITTTACFDMRVRISLTLCTCVYVCVCESMPVRASASGRAANAIEEAFDRLRLRQHNQR